MEKEKEKFSIHDTKAVDATVSRAGNESKKPKDHDFSVLKATKKKVATDRMSEMLQKTICCHAIFFLLIRLPCFWFILFILSNE